MTRNELISKVISLFIREFTEERLRSGGLVSEPWRPEEKRFKQAILDRGLHLVETTPDSLNCQMYRIVKFDYDEEGYPVQKDVCLYRRVVGIYSGCLVQLKDERGYILCEMGRIG